MRARRPIDLPCIVGPTGVGKTAVAIELAKILDGEIVSADSMQIYRGLDIATAKATPEEQKEARHHLIDIRAPDEPYSAAQWATDARAAIDEIVARGKRPIVTGGTGFYLRALLSPETLAATPANPVLRAELEAEAAEHGAEWMHQKLQREDSTAAARMHPNDLYRVIRALEIARSGAPATLVRRQLPPYTPRIYGLSMPREQLYARLEARVDAMLKRDFRAELEYAAQFAPELPSMAGVGYRQMRAALQDPALWEAGVAEWKRDSRRYAKRQMTWFRHQLPTQWVDVTEYDSPRAVAEFIATEYRTASEKIRTRK